MTNAVELFTAKAQAVQRRKDIATITRASGTMGKPKGVILTHANIVSNVLECAKLFPLNREDACISLLPLSHILERTLDSLRLDGCFAGVRGEPGRLPIESARGQADPGGRGSARAGEDSRPRDGRRAQGARGEAEDILLGIGSGETSLSLSPEGPASAPGVAPEACDCRPPDLFQGAGATGRPHLDSGFGRRSPGPGTGRVLPLHGPAGL